MPIPLIWGITVAFGFLAWGVFAAQYIWPAISKRERAEALRPILVLHGFRYIGLAVMIPGVVSPELPASEFARGLAYGDLGAATLALISFAALTKDQMGRSSGLDFYLIQQAWRSTSRQHQLEIDTDTDGTRRIHGDLSFSDVVTEPTASQIVHASDEAVLMTMTSDGGKGGGCFEGYWQFDSSGPHVLDFSAVTRAISERLPPGARFMTS